MTVTNVEYISEHIAKGTTKSSAKIAVQYKAEHEARLNRYAPQLRSALNSSVRNGVLDKVKVRDVFRRSMNSAALDIAKKHNIEIYPNDPTLLAELQNYVDNVDKLLKQTQVETLRAVKSILPAGLPKQEVAKRMKDVEHLDRRSGLALERYRQKLVPNNTPRQVDIAVARYKRELVTQRMNIIATHETGKVLAAAQETVIKIAIARGIYNANSTKTWIAQTDACSVCSTFNKKTVNIGAYFTSPVGSHYNPPAHPNCRCTYYVTTKA